MTPPRLCAETRRCPLCSREIHCGFTAALGEPIETERCINRSIVCLQCGATGVESTRKDLR